MKNSILHIAPTLTADKIGEANLKSGYTMDLWGSNPSDQCTGNQFYGCSRTSGAGGNILNPIQSAQLRTFKTFAFKYGRVEVRAKLPRGDWLWPAIWMLPRASEYGSWPASGEIDLIESRGNVRYTEEGGSDTVGSTLHWGPFFGEDPFDQTHGTFKLKDGKDFSDDFHTFVLEWSEDRIATYVDSPDNLIMEVDTTSKSFWERGGWDKTGLSNPWEGNGVNAPFDREFSLILNLAVGGTTGYWDDLAPGKPWRDADPHAVNSFWDAKDSWYKTWDGDNSHLQIDYIRVYQEEQDSSIL